MIDNLYRKRASEKKRCQLFENCANFACVQFSQSLIFATIGGFVQFECFVRFAHTARVCRWRSKPIRALVKGSATCLLDTMASMCLPIVLVGHGINKCLRGYAPGMHECLLTERDNI